MITLNFTDSQKKLLLEILAIHHQIEYMKGKDNTHTAELITKLFDSFKDAGCAHIFDEVFEEYKGET